MKKSLTLITLLFVLLVSKVSGNGSTQVIVTGVPPILPSPYVTDLENQYHQGQFQIQFIYTNSDPAPVEFIFEITASKDGEQLVYTESDPVAFTPGTYIYQTFNDLPVVPFQRNPLDQISGTLQEQIIRQGIFPEGGYTIEIEVRPVDNFLMINSFPAYVYFEVRYPQPPILITPVDDGTAPPIYNVFSWTPVFALPGYQFEYELLIVEVFDNQTPDRAIQANPVFIEHTTMQPMFLHTQEHFPFEMGQTYAWQVRASELQDRIPIADNGKSEIYTFTAGKPFADIDFNDLENIVVVPDFAQIVNLRGLDVQQTDNTFILNGTAVLELDFTDGSGKVEVTIECIDLEIVVTSQTSAVVAGGAFTGDATAVNFLQHGIGSIVTIEKVHWSLFEGLRADARIVDPSGQFLEAEGSLGISSSGFYGAVTATGPEGSPLLEIGADPFELVVNRLSAWFPSGQLTMDANLSYFGEPTPCQITDLYISDSPVTFSFNCNVQEQIPLLPNADLATLFINEASGNIELDWESATLDFSTSLVASLRLQALGADHYDIPALVSLSSTEGVQVQIWSPGVVLNPPALDLGLAQMKIHNIRDPYLSYDMTSSQWDFGIDLDAKLIFPDFDDLSISGFGDITLDKEGIHFPGQSFDESQLAFIPELKLAGFGAKLTAFSLSPFTFPWFDWDGASPGPWDFTFDFRFTTPEFSNELPACLRNLNLTVEGASFTGGSFTAELPATVFGDGQCAIEWGQGGGLTINELSGGIYGQTDGTDFSLDGFLAVDAELTLGKPFECQEGQGLPLTAQNLLMRGNGILEGTFANVIPTCPLKVGPFTAGFTSTELVFSANSPQQALFTAQAYIDFPAQDGGTIRVDGDLALDLVTGEWQTLEFHITQPFVWLVPEEDEVLRFNIAEASIGLDGLYINGSQEFVAGDETIPVSFDELLLDLSTLQVKSGSITFSHAFALEAGIEVTDFSLFYNTLPIGSSLSPTLEAGLYMELTGEVVIDTLGLRTSGTVNGEFKFGGMVIDKLTVEFSEDFAMGLDPFRVVSGSATVLYDDRIVAIIDQAGFHPNLAFFDLEAALPERLPLPSQNVAYLVIKQDDQLLVDVEQDPENELGVIISTKPGQPLEYVFPVLQGDQATPPSLQVEFSGVKISLSPFTFDHGEILVTIPDADDRFDLSPYGIPLNLRNIAYGVFPEEDIIHKGLFFVGDLVLFDEETEEGNTATMFVDANGTVVFSVEMDNLDASVPLVGGSELAVLNLEAISGYGQYNILNPQPPVFEFFIEGGFEIVADMQHRARADITLEYSNQGLTLTSFEYDASSESPSIDLDPFIFQVTKLHDLSISWDNEEGFDFYAGLDLAFGMRLEEDTLLVPVQGVELRPQGFSIPTQEINDASEPPLQVPQVELLGFALEIFAFRIDQVDVDVFNFSPGDLQGLIPRMDMALSFPGLTEMAPQMEGVALTINNAGYQNGRLTGSVEVHEPLQPIEIPMGDLRLKIERFAGILEEGNPSQIINIDIEGEIPELLSFESDQDCPPATFALSIIQGSGFSGSVSNFVPCGELPIGSLSLAFTSSDLEFSFADGHQQATLEGSAQLNIPSADNEGETAHVQGELAFDLIEGRIAGGALQISDAFNWNVPVKSENPFFTFVVEQARLDTLGLTLRANGQMIVADGVVVDVAFDDLVFDLRDLEIVGGQATLGSDFALDLLFLPVVWQMVAPGQPLPSDSNVIRMNFESLEIVLNKHGFSLSGSSSAQLRMMQQGSQEEDDDGNGDEDEQWYDNLRLEFSDDFMMYTPPRSYARSGKAELWLDEDQESTLLAWYDEDGLGIGDFLGIMPIPDTLALPTREIAYLILKDDEGLLVELDTSGEGRTLQTLPGRTVDLVIAGISDDQGNNPRFNTAFSITVNDAFEITDGSIYVELENNPWEVPDLPIKITSLTYEKREDGVAALSASALLDLPESLNDLQVVIDEVRFSEHGFEQATFSMGDPDFNVEDDPEFAMVFADSALVVNVNHALVAFGEDQSFAFSGSFQSNMFRDEESNELSYLPFTASYEQLPNPGGQWSFALDMDYTEPIALSYAEFAITQMEATASAQEFALVLSGIVSMPDLLGEDFAVTIENLSLGTQGISVGEVSVEAQEQEFSLFNDRVKVLVSAIAPTWDSQERVLYIGLDGALEVLEREIVFSDMTIGTDGSFNIGAGIDVNLLTQDLVILENHLVVSELSFGINQQNRLRLGVGGSVTLPEPFTQTADFTVQLSQTDRNNVDISLDGPQFQFAQGYGISHDRTQVTLGDFATLELTAAAVELDFKDMTNTTLLATAVVYLENDVDKRIRFGESANIADNWGFRFNYNDGVQWKITSAPNPGNPLFEFDSGIFAVSITGVGTGESSEDFSVEIAGSARLTIPGFSGSADFSGFTVSKNGVEDYGRFDKNVTFTLMDKVSLSLGDFVYEPNGGLLTLAAESESSDMENPESVTMSVMTTQYLIISDASLTINGAGDGGAFDSFGGGVDEVLFYRTPEGGTYLYIDNAFVELGDVASMSLSMRYITEEDFFHLSVVGNGEFKFGESGAAIGVAGKIEKSGNDISFGLFVRADVSPGIPIIPGIITLQGVGGGFYYRPSPQDFTDVRTASAMEFLQTPELDSGTRFGAFLYASVGIIGENNVFYIDGSFFLEITDQFASMYVNGLIMNQPKENLFANMALTIYYGEEQMFQGLIRVDVTYNPVVTGMGQIGFFAQKQQNNVIWAIFGEKHLSVLGAINMQSQFIICNDGMLIDTGLGIYYSGWGITIDASLEASIWYMKNNGFGVYGKAEGSISGYGVTVGGYLYGAYISKERLFYASGGVYIDVILFSGTLNGWVAYKGGKWDGGRGSNPEYMALINSSRQEALNMANSANEAMAGVSAAQQALEDAANTQALIDEILDFVDNMHTIQNMKADMDAKVASVTQLAPVVIDRLDNAIVQSIELLEETQELAQELDNPVSFNPGLIAGDGEDMEVMENPSIAFDQSTADQNESTAEQEQENIQERLEYYREIIAKAMGNLTELELIIDGQSYFLPNLLDLTTTILGEEYLMPINTYQVSFEPLTFENPLLDPPNFQLIGFGTSMAMNNMAYSNIVISEGVTLMNGSAILDYIFGYSAPSFNQLGQEYAEAVEAVKRFYATYHSVLWANRRYWINTGQHQKASAALAAIEISTARYEADIPVLEASHAEFTQSLDLLYSIKAQMATTIYSMLHAYALILESALEEEELMEIEQSQYEIAQMLEPPVISSLMVNPNYFNMRNRATISWVAQHPDEVAETSYSINPSGIGPFKSAGDLESIKHYTFKRNVSELQRNYTIAVRARGSGGNTSIVSTQVTLAVDANGTSTPGGEQIPDNVPPPSQPWANFLHYTEYMNQFIPVRAYTDDPNRINLTIEAYAPSSDIASFQFALGTQVGATNVLDWTDAVGVLEPVSVEEGGITRRITTSILGLSLEHNTNYYVSVRAFNTQGLYSERSQSLPLLYDGTPPSTPVNQSTTPFYVTFASPTTTFPFVTSIPGWQSPKYNVQGNFAPPEVTLNWGNAEDPESGIRHFEYVLTSVASPQEAFEQIEDIKITTEETVTLSGFGVSYTDSLYFHVRAVNRAGGKSDPLTIYPIIAIDPTRPTAPKINGFAFLSALAVYLPQVSLDLESQTVGYRYSVGTSPGSSNVRSWSSDFILDQQFFAVRIGWAWSIIPQEPHSVPFFNVPKDGLPQQTNLYVNVRAVNSQGRASAIASTGPFQLGSAPSQATISPVYSNNSLSISIGNIYDPGLPILSVRYRVLNSTGGVVRNWTTIANSGGMYTQPGSLEVYIPVITLGTSYTVEVRVMNYAGVTTQSSYTKPSWTLPLHTDFNFIGF